MNVVEAVALVLAGVLAGEEFVVRWGVQPALRSLPDVPHVHARVALVKRLKVLVPVIMVPTVLAAVAVVAFGGTGPGLAFRWAAVGLLGVFLLFSFLGTVPINIRVNDWQPDAPPADWKDTVHRWEQIDVFRSTAALGAFVCEVIAVVLQFP